MEFLSGSPRKTADIAALFARELRPGDFVALYGGMGAGKTHFVKGLGETLCPGDDITSPTFALVHEHHGALTLYHFDMYRVASEDDLYSTGFYDYLDGQAVVVTEWSENIDWVLPECRWRVQLAPGAAPDERVISIDRVGDTRVFAGDGL